MTEIPNVHIVRKENVKVFLILKKDHQLCDAQIEILNEKFGEHGYNVVEIPDDGLTMNEQVSLAKELKDTAETVVFASELPVFEKYVKHYKIKWLVFVNDNEIVYTHNFKRWELF